MKLERLFIFLTRLCRPDKSKRDAVVEDLRFLGKSLIAGGVLSGLTKNSEVVVTLIVIFFGCILWIYSINMITDHN